MTTGHGICPHSIMRMCLRFNMIHLLTTHIIQRTIAFDTVPQWLDVMQPNATNVVHLLIGERMEASVEMTPSRHMSTNAWSTLLASTNTNFLD